jgi:hypothetical protein
MKFFLAIIGIIFSGIMGYVLEPSMRNALMGRAVVITVPASPTETEEVPAAETPPPAPTPSYDYSGLQPSQLPEKMVLKMAVVARIAGESDALPLPAGTKVKPLRIDGKNVHFSVAGTAQGKIAVDQTNLVEQLIANPPPAPVTTPSEPTVAENQPTPQPVVDPMPVKEPEVAPGPAKQPEAGPAPQPVSGSTLTAEEIVKLMQESIRSGQIKEFTFDQVTGWKAGEEEESEGEKYQTGLAAYKAETIFGVKNIQAKAMIQGGKVVRWIWPTSGLEIQ